MFQTEERVRVLYCFIDKNQKRGRTCNRRGESKQRAYAYVAGDSKNIEKQNSVKLKYHNGFFNHSSEKRRRWDSQEHLPKDVAEL